MRPQFTDAKAITVLCALAAAGSLGLVVTLHAQPELELDRFVGRDLWKQHAPNDDLRYLNELIGSVPKGFMMEPTPWRVWKIDREGQVRYIILLGEDLEIIPGGSSACIQLLDAATRKINRWSFQTGWRIALQDASFEYSANLSSDLIVLHTVPVINGRRIVNEYFAISHDRLRLVRLENDKGELVQNEYVFPNMEIGVIPDEKTVDQWVKLLESNDKTDVLSALTFMGGRHIAGSDRKLVAETHQSKYAELFLQLAGSTRIKELIQRLVTSDDEWVRQAAVLASRGPLDRPWQ